MYLTLIAFYPLFLIFQAFLITLQMYFQEQIHLLLPQDIALQHQLILNNKVYIGFDLITQFFLTDQVLLLPYQMDELVHFYQF